MAPRLRRGVLASLALAVAGLPLAAATTTGLTQAAAASPPAWTAYVTSSAPDNTVTPINTATNATGTPIGMGTNTSPVGVAVTPDGKTAYVALSGAASVTPIDTATNTAGTAITVGTFPRGVAITPDGKTAYVTNSGSDNVTPIDIATNIAKTPITVGTGPETIAVTPNGKTAYVTNSGSDNVTPIDIATNIAKTPITVGSGPAGIAVTPDGSTAYVANGGPGSTTVTPIDTATNTPLTPIVAGTQPVGVAITPDGKTAYVANSGSQNVTPIDIATNTPGNPIKVGIGPNAVAITPDGKTAYVTNGAFGPVTPIDIATNTPGNPIGAGQHPDGVAVTPDQAPAAHLSVTPAHVGSPSEFDASASTVRFGTIASYAWNFGDGTSATTTTPTTAHTYTFAGTYTASVTETSSGGTSTTKVFTGQTMSRNGGPSATDSAPVTVPASAPPGAGVATSPQFGVPNQTDLFDVNNNGAVEVRWADGAGAWNGPLSISPTGLAPPGAHVAASNQFGVPNQTDVFVVGNDGATRVLWVDGAAKWNGPSSVTSANTAPSGAALATSNQFGIGNQTDLFVVGNDGATQVSWVQSAGTWHGPLGITPTSTAPAGAHLATSAQFGVPNQTDVFVVGNDGATQVSWVQGAGTWHGPLAITPASTAPAGAGIASSNQLGIGNQTDVFVVDSTGAIRVSWVQGPGAWHGPLAITLAGNSPNGAHLAASSQFGVPNQTDVFLVNNSGSAQVSWVQGAGAWKGPLQI